MQYKVGETVVYPHHGPATILDVKKRKIGGEEKLWLTLRIHENRLAQGSDSEGKAHVGDLEIQIPAENCELVGVRDIIDQDDLDEVFKVLRAEFIEEHSNWSRRFKANGEKLASSDVIRISEVVRDLWRREQDRGLSTGEKSMFAKARQILISELALAEKTDQATAGKKLEEVLASAS
ncbi:MAG TPA: CarD family transcriptional regulator [Microbacteriaceae bacterium]|nr:CarD family transcriptional regulator [Microbacteriaceae bacterium]